MNGFQKLIDSFTNETKATFEVLILFIEIILQKMTLFFYNHILITTHHHYDFLFNLLYLLNCEAFEKETKFFFDGF